MYLTNRQLLLLLLPFLIVSVLYLSLDTLLHPLRYLLPSYQEYKNKILDKKASIYLEIAKKNEIFEKIMRQIRRRREEVDWASEKGLYRKKEEVRKVPERRPDRKYKVACAVG